MHGTNNYEIWVKKYGIEEANKRRKQSSKTQSKNTKGKKKKPISEEHRKNIGLASKGRKHSEKSKQKISIGTSGKKNGMHGKSLFNLWVEKYGIEEANKRMDKKSRKTAISRKKYYLEHPEDNYFISKCEIYFLDCLEIILNCKIERGVIIGSREFDGKIENTKILIESDGSWCHNIEKDKIKDNQALENGYIVLRFENNSIKEVDENLKTIHKDKIKYLIKIMQ